MQWWRRPIVMSFLAVGSVTLVYWFETAAPTGRARSAAIAADAVIVAVFLADWILGYRAAERKKRYLWRHGWHLLGMVPLAVTQLGFLRLLRLARLFRLLDLMPGVRRRVARVTRAFRGTELRGLAYAGSAITLGGAVLVWLAERDHNSDLAELSESVWWAIVTVTTVGYGDITPITRMGRAVAVILMVTGIGTIGLLASQVSAAVVRHEEDQIQEEAMAASSPDTVAGQLAMLAALHDEGKLDDDEFQAAKQVALGQRRA